MEHTTGNSTAYEETEVSKSIKAFAVLGVVALVAACGAAQPEPVSEPEAMPVMAEPTMGKM